jgi:hypothetical protein
VGLACSVPRGGRPSPRIADSRPGGALLTQAEWPRWWHGSRCGTGRWKVHHVALRCLLRRESYGTRRCGDHHGQYASGAPQAGGRSRRAGRYPRSRRPPLPLAADIRRGAGQHRCSSGQTRLGAPEAGPRGRSGLGGGPRPEGGDWPGPATAVSREAELMIAMLLCGDGRDSVPASEYVLTWNICEGRTAGRLLSQILVQGQLTSSWLE